MFNVSRTSVAKHAREEGWPATRQAHNERVERKLLDRTVRTREERAEHLLRIHDEVSDQLQEQLEAKRLDLKLSDFPALAKVAALYAGEPTDRVSFDEMQAGFRTLLSIAARFVPKGKRAEFLAEVNEALGASE